MENPLTITVNKSILMHDKVMKMYKFIMITVEIVRMQAERSKKQDNDLYNSLL